MLLRCMLGSNICTCIHVTFYTAFCYCGHLPCWGQTSVLVSMSHSTRLSVTLDIFHVGVKHLCLYPCHILHSLLLLWTSSMLGSNICTCIHVTFYTAFCYSGHLSFWPNHLQSGQVAKNQLPNQFGNSSARWSEIRSWHHKLVMLLEASGGAYHSLLDADFFSC